MKKLITLLACVTILVVNSTALAANSVNYSVPFTDVQPGDYYYVAIDDIVSRNIANGYGDGTFGTDRLVTRAEATKFIANTVGLECDGYANTEPDFSDTKNTVGLKMYIACFQAQGYINGYGDGRFGPQDPVRKAEFFKMLFNAAGLNVDMSDTHDFADLQDDTLTPYITLAINISILPQLYPALSDSSLPMDNVNLQRGSVVNYVYGFIMATKRNNLAGTYDIPERALSNQTIHYYLVSNDVDDMNDIDQYMVLTQTARDMNEIGYVDFVKEALTVLFLLEQSQYGDNNNFLYESDVSVDDVYWVGQHEAVVELSGDIVGIGSGADPFIKEQILKTIEYYATERGENLPTIKLNGSEENWECLFDMSGLCGT